MYYITVFQRSQEEYAPISFCGNGFLKYTTGLYRPLVILISKVRLKIQNTLIKHTPVLKYFNRTIILDN